MSTVNRDALLSQAKTVVVKVGSNALADPDKGIQESRIRKIAKGIAWLKKQGLRVLLVSSGAVGCGRNLTDDYNPKSSVPRKQALSAIGQIKLMSLYSQAFSKQGFLSSQILVAKENLNNRRQYHNLSNCISELLALDVIPIINENDALATEELIIGDNDTIAALLSTRVGADVLCLLTVVDGVLDEGGKCIGEIKRVRPDAYELEGMTKSSFGTGGMKSKLGAAKLAANGGTGVIIANATTPNILQTIFSGKAGKSVGTFIPPTGNKLNGMRKWILAANHSKKASVRIDDGASKALITRGKSLLPAGVIAVKGDFQEGDVIEVLNAKGVPVACGMSNYDSEDIRQIMGKHSAEIKKIIKSGLYDEIIHRNNLVILERDA